MAPAAVSAEVMSDPPDDPDSGPRSDPDRREPQSNRRGSEDEWRAIDRQGTDADRRAADRSRSDTIRERTDRRGTDAAGPTGAADPDDERASRHAADSPGHAADLRALRWLSGVVSLVGLWIAASAIVYETTTAALWNNAVVGAAIFLLAGYGFYRLARDHRPDVGSTSLAALLGLWAVVAPFLLTYPSDALVWSTVASGIAVAVLSGYNAYESRRSVAVDATGSRA